MCSGSGFFLRTVCYGAARAVLPDETTKSMKGAGMTPARDKNICFTVQNFIVASPSKWLLSETYNFIFSKCRSVFGPSGETVENNRGDSDIYRGKQNTKSLERARKPQRALEMKRIFFKSRETEPCFISKGCFPESLFFIEANDE